jgi:hypothetical protein
VVGVDVRLPWAVALGFKGMSVWWKTGKNRISTKAICGWISFLLIAVVGLLLLTEKVASNDLYEAWSLLLYVIAGGFIFYSVQQLPCSEDELGSLVRVLTVVTAVVGLLVVIEGVTSYRVYGGAGRVEGPLGNPNTTAAYLAVSSTCLVLLNRLHRVGRLFVAVAVPIACLGCILTLSRMGAVALFVGITSAALINPNAKLFTWKSFLILLAMSILGSGLTITYLVQYRQSVTAASENAAQLGSMRAEQALEDLSRWEALKYAAQLTTDHPVAGVGFATLASRNFTQNGVFVTTHNTFMQVLAGTGLLGAASLMFAVLTLVTSRSVAGRRTLVPAAIALTVCACFGDLLQCLELYVVVSVLYACTAHLEHAYVPESQFDLRA